MTQFLFVLVILYYCWLTVTTTTTTTIMTMTMTTSTSSTSRMIKNLHRMNPSVWMRVGHYSYYSSLFIIWNVPNYVDSFLLLHRYPSMPVLTHDNYINNRKGSRNHDHRLHSRIGDHHHLNTIQSTVRIRNNNSRPYCRPYSSIQTLLFSTHNNNNNKLGDDINSTSSDSSSSSSSKDSILYDDQRSSSSIPPPAAHSSSSTTTYRQFTELSKEILRHDELYYNYNNNNNNNDNDHPQGKGGGLGTTTTTSTTDLLSDEEFDALVRLEEKIILEHPDWAQRWYEESGGMMTVRSQRVGASVKEDEGRTVTSNPTTTTTTTTIPSRSNSTSSSNTSTVTTTRLKREHLSPMLSLDNALNEEQLFGWIRRVMKAAAIGSHHQRKQQDEEQQQQQQRQQQQQQHQQQKGLEQRGTINDDDGGTRMKESVTPVVTFVTEPKLDGVSLSIRYEVEYYDGDDGIDNIYNNINNNSKKSNKPTDDLVLKLEWASTRGDGRVGQDVTPAALQMRGIPKMINLGDIHNNNNDDDGGMGSNKILQLLQQHNVTAVEVRGEVVLPRSDFLYLQSQADVGRIGTTNAVNSNDESVNVDKNETVTSTTTISSDEGPTNNGTTTTATATTMIIPTFSNARNAASGVLLRKEIVDDPEAQVELEELRSRLQFYAYDFTWSSSTTSSGRERSTGKNEMDGMKIRSCLSDWGFQLALPVETTHVQLNVNDGLDLTDRNTSWWEEWMQQRDTQQQLEPMLRYYSALEEHRRILGLDRTDDSYGAESVTERASTKKESPKRTKSSASYEWGDFDMDGCVHKVAQPELRTLMGYSMKSPKWAIAHKFPAEAAVSQLLDISIQVGRTGSLTPVAVLEPVEVGGVTIQRATLHNFRHLQEILGGGDANNGGTIVARIPKNEPVLVRRAGDVIPQVVKRIGGNISVAHSENEDQLTDWISLEPPTKCPACGSPVVWEETKTISSSNRTDLVGQVVRCGGPPLLCPPRAITSLAHAFSRDALDVTGLSEARIQNLMDAGLVRYPHDIFQMDDDAWEKASRLPGWGKKSCNNLRGSIQRVATNGVSLSRFIYSLGIRHAGKHTSELVASAFGSASMFMDALDEASKCTPSHLECSSETDVTGKDEVSTQLPFPTLQNQLGVGPALIESLVAFSKSEDLMSAARSLAASVIVKEEFGDDAVRKAPQSADIGTGIRDMSRPWDGFRVVFTGTLTNISRSEAHGLAKQLGARSTPGSVSKSTDLLVYGDKGGKKLEQARGLGISTMTNEEFVELVRKNGLWDGNE